MATVPLSGREREEVLEAYVTTALWTATNEAGAGFDGYADKTVDDLPDMAQEIRDNVNGFIDLVEELSILDHPEHDPRLVDPWAGMDPGQIGHDLWLTSGRHGAGFWDRGLGARGDALTKWAQTFTPPLVIYVDKCGTEWVA